MQIHRTRSLWLMVSIGFMLLVAGCFQPAGAGLEATNVAQALPTFTPVPTDTPTIEPTAFPSLTPPPSSELLIAGQTLQPSPDGGIIIASAPTDAGTSIAQGIDPIWQTATAIFLEQIGEQPIEPPQQVDPQQDTPPVFQIEPTPEFLLPDFQTATQIIFDSTATAAFPMTQTAQALFPPTDFPTPDFGFPTATLDFGAPVPSGQDCIHEVQQSDRNLFRIGLAYGVPYMDIARITPVLNPNLIVIGQRLVIPGCGTTGRVPPPTSTPSLAANPNNPNPQQPQPQPGGPTPTSAFAGQVYTVIGGDTLFGLSLLWGTTVNEIASRNPEIFNINLIFIGQQLAIP